MYDNCKYFLIYFRYGCTSVPNRITLKIIQAPVLIDSICGSIADDCLLTVASISVVVLALSSIISAVLVVAKYDALLEAHNC